MSNSACLEVVEIPSEQWLCTDLNRGHRLHLLSRAKPSSPICLLVFSSFVQGHCRWDLVRCQSLLNASVCISRLHGSRVGRHATTSPPAPQETSSCLEASERYPGSRRRFRTVSSCRFRSMGMICMISAGLGSVGMGKSSPNLSQQVLGAVPSGFYGECTY